MILAITRNGYIFAIMGILLIFHGWSTSQILTTTIAKQINKINTKKLSILNTVVIYVTGSCYDS